MLPPAMLCAALAFALAAAPLRLQVAALAVLALVAVAASRVSIPAAWHDGVFTATWATVAVLALAVHRRDASRPVPAIGLAIVAGLAAGAVVAVSATLADLGVALMAALLVFPAGWLVRHRGGIAVKVAASWLVAVAMLAAALPLVPTPGYVPDHME